MNDDAPPTKAIVHIQKTAPGPPMAIAVATPAMLPTPTRLAAEIVKLLKDDELRGAYGAAGRDRVAEHFGVDKLVDGTLECYRRFSSQPTKSS